MMSSAPPPSPYAPKRQWKLILGIILGAVLIIGLAIGEFVYSIFGILRGSDPAKLAVQMAEADPRVAQRIGVPLKTGTWVSGNINTTGTTGSAVLDIPVSGPKGEGSLHVEAMKAAGDWKITTLNFAADGPVITRIVPDPNALPPVSEP